MLRQFVAMAWLGSRRRRRRRAARAVGARDDAGARCCSHACERLALAACAALGGRCVTGGAVAAVVFFFFAFFLLFGRALTPRRRTQSLSRMVSLKLQKRLAASVLRCGKNKVWVDPNEISVVSMASTRKLRGELRRARATRHRANGSH